MNFKKWQEEAEKRGKKLLIESYSFSNFPKENIIIPEKPLLVESNGSKFSARAILKNVPVTKFTENKNGRIYPKKLWERIQKEKIAEGNLSLADHPGDDSDGSIKDICAVWHNFSVTENYGKADWYLIGNHGQLILEAVQAGGSVGISSVGFGEFQEDEKTVNTESYELQRLGDAVISPSQDVFATYENFSEAIEEVEKIEEVVEKSINLQENITNKKEGIIPEENCIMIDKIQESNLKNQVRLALKEAKNKDNYTESLEDLKALKDIIPAEMSESHEKIDGAISEITTKMDEHIKNSSKLVSEKEETIVSLKEKLDVTEKTLESLKEKYQKASDLLEAVKEADSKKSSISEKELEKISILKENCSNMLSDIKRFSIDRKNMLADIECFKEDTQNMSHDIGQFKKLSESQKNKIKTLSKKLNFAETHISKLEKILEDEFGYEFEDDDVIVDNEFDAMDSDIDYADPIQSDVIEPYEFYDEEEEDSDSDPDFLEADESKDDEDEIKEADEKDDEDEKIEEADDDDKEEDDDDKMAKVRAAKKESNKSSVKESFILKKKLNEFYVRLSRENPSVKDIKHQILNSKSLIEAVNKFNKFKERQNDVVKVEDVKTVSKINPNWLGNRF